MSNKTRKIRKTYQKRVKKTRINRRTKKKQINRRIKRTKKTKRKQINRRTKRRNTKMKGGGDIWQKVKNVVKKKAIAVSQVQKVFSSEKIVYRIGIELEGCYDINVIESDLPYILDRTVGHSNYPLETYPALDLDCSEVHTSIRIDTIHFERVEESFPCKISPTLVEEFSGLTGNADFAKLSKESPQFRHGEKTQCSTELILKSDNEYYVCLTGEEISYLTTNEDTTQDVTTQINLDVDQIMDKLEPDLSEGLDNTQEDMGLELHFHISDESMVARGENFLSTGTLRFCMVLCLLWYGCPEKYDTSFYDQFVKLGYNHDRRVAGENAYQNPSGGPIESRLPHHYQVVDEYRPVPEINWEEFERIFEGLSTEEGIENCICYLLKTMYPNNYKYMPIHIYNLSEILNLYGGALGYIASEFRHGDYHRVVEQYHNKDIVTGLTSIMQANEGNVAYGFRKASHLAPTEFHSSLLIGDYKSLPLRIEFRASKLKRENHDVFLRNYSALIAKFFDYAKKVATLQSLGDMQDQFKDPRLVLGESVEIFPPMKLGITRGQGYRASRLTESLKGWLTKIHMQQWYDVLVNAGFDHVLDLVFALQKNSELFETTLNKKIPIRPHVDTLISAVKRYAPKEKA